MPKGILAEFGFMQDKFIAPITINFMVRSCSLSNKLKKKTVIIKAGWSIVYFCAKYNILQVIPIMQYLLNFQKTREENMLVYYFKKEVKLYQLNFNSINYSLINRKWK